VSAVVAKSSKDLDVLINILRIARTESLTVNIAGGDKNALRFRCLHSTPESVQIRNGRGSLTRTIPEQTSESPAKTKHTENRVFMARYIISRGDMGKGRLASIDSYVFLFECPDPL
jgi:hypothetical protein